MNSSRNKLLLTGASMLIAGVIIGCFLCYYFNFNKETTQQITSFEECVRAGYDILKSNPEQCKTPDGKTFINSNVNSNDNSSDDIACTMDAQLCPDGSYVGRTPPSCEFAPCPDKETPSDGGVFGSSTTLDVSGTEQFTDGLTITLREINDSRCEEGMVCIWEGELSPVFLITGGNAGKSLKEIRLGTSRTKSATENGYTFTLEGATETSATITVTKNQ